MFTEFFESPWFALSLVVGFLLLTILPNLSMLFYLGILFIAFALGYVWDLFMLPSRVARINRKLK